MTIMKVSKGFYTNYEITHMKIKKAICDIIAEGGDLSVKQVAKRSGIGVTTAYEHKAHHMIKEILNKDSDDVEIALKEVDSVTQNELQNWTDRICKRYKLPKCDVTIFIEMDEMIGVFGENDGGCMVFYDYSNPGKFCVAVEKDVLKNRQFVYDTLQVHLWNYKKFIDEEE